MYKRKAFPQGDTIGKGFIASDKLLPLREEGWEGVAVGRELHPPPAPPSQGGEMLFVERLLTAGAESERTSRWGGSCGQIPIG